MGKIPNRFFLSLDSTQFCRVWDYVVLDEGHIIKNPTTKVTRAMHSLRTRHRLMLTGTPIQNNLMEFWSLVDWATESQLFGSQQDFTRDYATPILIGQEPRASEAQRKISKRVADELLAKSRNILLQRKKCDNEEVLQLPAKREVTVWITLSQQQRRLYEDFIRSKAFNEALNRKNFPVEVINRLKTLSRHPFLIEASEKNYQRKQSKEVLNRRTFSFDVDDIVASMKEMSIAEDSSDLRAFTTEDELTDDRPGHTVFEMAGRLPSSEELLDGSMKLQILVKVVEQLVDNGHR